MTIPSTNPDFREYSTASPIAEEPVILTATAVTAAPVAPPDEPDIPVITTAETVPTATATTYANHNTNAMGGSSVSPSPYQETKPGAATATATATTGPYITTTAQQSNTVFYPTDLGTKSCHMRCPYCVEEMDTHTSRHMGCFGPACGWATVIAFTPAWPLFWIPLVSRRCKTTRHFCSKCGMEVGKQRARWL